MGGGLKEKAVLAALATVVLYAAAAGLWFFRQGGPKGEWAKARAAYEKACRKYRDEQNLIAKKARWIESYEEEKTRMPIFEAGKNTDTTWLAKMDEIAAKNFIQISNRQAGAEVEAGEVLELPIEVKNWEGALESLVHFIYELENSGAGMFDVRAISFKPSSKTGYLKGSFTLTCAYMRGD